MAALSQSCNENKAWPLCPVSKINRAVAPVVDLLDQFVIYFDRGASGGHLFFAEHKDASMEGANSDEAEPLSERLLASLA